ncbi:MAG: hypothetical protein L6R39_000441 [Caloplaca ligustica]|nr:MAG: hypothetical protein L6R39_000441 [Caloplaca ligustica]
MHILKSKSTINIHPTPLEEASGLITQCDQLRRHRMEDPAYNKHGREAGIEPDAKELLHLGLMAPEAESDISDWEVDEGLPQLTDPFIQKYYQGREALIEQEKAQRSDDSFRQSLTPLAATACAIVSRIRGEEHQTLWSDEHAGNTPVAGINHYPGMMFSLAKQRLEQSKTYQILKKMPKGALLHAHLDAMIDPHFLVDQVLTTEGMVMQASQGLHTAEAREQASVTFEYSNSLDSSAPSIWSDSYQAGHLVPVTVAAESFPGGLEGFKAWLVSRATITPEESLDHHHGIDAIWQKFGSCFPVLGSIFRYEPIFRASIQRLFRQLRADGLQWADLRMAFVAKFWKKGHDEPDAGQEALFQAFGEELAKFQTTEEGNGWWGCRFIWTTLRMYGKREMVDHMKQCIAIKKAYPHLIAGYDVVGQEDKGRTLADLTPELFWFKKKCMEEGINIPFFFHAGECLGDGDETDQNLFDAILLGTRRIGHGFSLYKHPLLIELVKQKKILIEACPISNEVLRLTSSIKAHPLPALLARGVSVALCNDDPAILGVGSNGLTHDFWQALQGWDNLGLEGLGSLAEDSVRYATFEPDQDNKAWSKDIRDGKYGEGIRAARMREWTAQWNEFCQWILMEYAEYASDDDGEV